MIQGELRSKNGIKQNVIRIAFKKGSFWHIVITILYHKVSWTPELSLTSKEKTTGKPK